MTAVERINAHGGVRLPDGAHPFELVTFDSKGSVDDLNRLGGFSGALTQSNNDQGAEAIPASDLKTAEALGARVAAVVSNKADAKGLAFARQEGIDTAVVNHKDYPSRDAFECQSLNYSTPCYQKLQTALATLGIVSEVETRVD